MLDEVGETLDPYHFTLENHSDVASEYTIYLDDMDLEDGETRMNDSFVKYQLTKDGTKNMALLSTTGTHPNRVLDTGTISGNTTITYDLRLWIDENTGNEAMGQVVKTKIRVVAVQSETVEEEKGPSETNENILAIYQYNAASCITGEEETCNKMTTAPATYTTGTIVKYKVNDTEEKYFHVISDNGDTLTMQQRENTIYATKWYDGESGNDNSQGPITVLPALENATANWTNVNDQTYTMGVTTFKTNAFTGCGYTECTTNTYTLGNRTGKARMITAQEAGELGCTSSNQSCPAWMNNYLKNSTSYAGTVNETGGEYGNNAGYWTMSSYSPNATSAIIVYYYGKMSISSTKSADCGARAVVVIDK